MIEHEDHCVICVHWDQANEECMLSCADPETFFKECPEFKDEGEEAAV